MDLYLIRRRAAWASLHELEAAGKRSAAERDKAASGVRSIRTYVVAEDGDRLGSVCIYQAESPAAIKAHADAAGLPADEIVKVADTAIVNPDPEPVTA